jgi:hypothetical protein
MFPPLLSAGLFAPPILAATSSAIALHCGAVALALLCVYALGRRVANATVAAATMLCIALHPAFLAQALAAAPSSASVMLATALMALALCCSAPRRGEREEVAGGDPKRESDGPREAGWRQARVVLSAVLLLAALALTGLRVAGVWPAGGASDEAARGAAVGYLAGVWAHLKHLTVTSGLWALTLSGLAAMLLAPRRDNGRSRPRIAVPVQLTFAALILAYAALLPLFGADTARDALPALPPIVLIWVSTLWRRVPLWPLVVALICALFVLHFG